MRRAIDQQQKQRLRSEKKNCLWTVEAIRCDVHLLPSSLLRIQRCHRFAMGTAQRSPVELFFVRFFCSYFLFCQNFIMRGEFSVYVWTERKGRGLCTTSRIYFEQEPYLNFFFYFMHAVEGFLLLLMVKHLPRGRYKSNGGNVNARTSCVHMCIMANDYRDLFFVIYTDF